MDKRGLSDLSPADLQEWRRNPVSAVLLGHLQHERTLALESIAASIREQRHHDAALMAGGLNLIDDVWDRLHPPEPPPQEEEEPYVDPGTIVEPVK